MLGANWNVSLFSIHFLLCYFSCIITVYPYILSFNKISFLTYKFPFCLHTYVPLNLYNSCIGYFSTAYFALKKNKKVLFPKLHAHTCGKQNNDLQRCPRPNPWNPWIWYLTRGRGALQMSLKGRTLSSGNSPRLSRQAQSNHRNP